MPYCPLCNKPLLLVPSAFPENFCQCVTHGLTLSITLTQSDHTTMLTNAGNSVHEPEHTPIPKGIYDAFRDEELAL